MTPNAIKKMVATILDFCNVAIPWMLCRDVHPFANRAPNPSKVPPAKNQNIYPTKNQFNSAVNSPIWDVMIGMSEIRADKNPPNIIPVMKIYRQLNLSL